MFIETIYRIDEKEIVIYMESDVRIMLSEDVKKRKKVKLCIPYLNSWILKTDH